MSNRRTPTKSSLSGLRSLSPFSDHANKSPGSPNSPRSDRVGGKQIAPFTSPKKNKTKVFISTEDENENHAPRQNQDVAPQFSPVNSRVTFADEETVLTERNGPNSPSKVPVRKSSLKSSSSSSKKPALPFMKIKTPQKPKEQDKEKEKEKHEPGHLLVWMWMDVARSVCQFSLLWYFFFFLLVVGWFWVDSVVVDFFLLFFDLCLVSSDREDAEVCFFLLFSCFFFSLKFLSVLLSSILCSPLFFSLL